MVKKILLPILLFVFSISSAQNSEDPVGSWTLISGTHKITEKWSIPTIAILQTYEVYDNFQFILARTGISYDINTKINGTLGYDYLYSEPNQIAPGIAGKTNHLIFQQFVLKDSYKKLGFNHRYRLESIWTTQNSETNFSNRIRYRLRLDHPVYKSLYAAVFNEVLLNTQRPYFNHNRIFTGIGYIFSPNYKMELGYFANYFTTTTQRRIRVAIIFNTDFFSGR